MSATGRRAPAFRKWRQAQDAFDNDPALKRSVDKLQRLSQHYIMARSQGRGLSGDDIAELTCAQEEVQASPLYRQREQAGSELMLFLQQVNEILSKSLGLNFAANAAARGGGGCCG